MSEINKLIEAMAMARKRHQLVRFHNAKLAFRKAVAAYVKGVK